MTEEQVKRWLGFPGADKRRLRPEIIDGMRDIPWPTTSEEQMDAFRVFLRCWPEGHESLFVTGGQ